MRLRGGWIWYLAGFLLAGIAGVTAVLALRQAMPTEELERPTTRPVIIARRDIRARQIVPSDALEAREFPLDEIPSGAIFSMEDAVGRLSVQEIRAGQPLLAQYLMAPLAGPGAIVTTTAQLAALLPEDKVAVALPADDLLGKSGDVTVGDRVDIMASLIVASTEEGKGGQVTLMNLQNISVVRLLRERGPEQRTTALSMEQEQILPPVIGLVLAVDPQDAVILKYFIDSGAKVSIDLRPPRLMTVFDARPVTINYIADKYGVQVPEQLK